MSDLIGAAAGPSNCTARVQSDTRVIVEWETDGRAAYVERQVDEDQWVQVASFKHSGGLYNDYGARGNKRYRYRVRGEGSAEYATSNFVYTTPAPPWDVTLSRLSETRVLVQVVSVSPWADSFLCRLSVNGSPYGPDREMGESAEFEVGAGEVRAMVCARKGDLKSPYREASRISGATAPGAPTLGKIDHAYAIPAKVAVSWRANHPDGSVQTAAQVELTGPGGSRTMDVSGDSSSLTIQIDAAGSYRVRVRTKGMLGSFGPWSGYAPFVAGSAPQAYFTSPAIDGAVVEVAPVVVEWGIDAGSSITSQVITVRQQGSIAYSAVLDGSPRSFEFGPNTLTLLTGREYVVSLEVTDGNSLKATTSRRFLVDLAEPAIPTAFVDVDKSDLSAHIVVSYGERSWSYSDGMLRSPEFWGGESDHIDVGSGFNGLPDGGFVGMGAVAPTVSVSVARKVDGVQELICEDIGDRCELIDRLPPLNVDYEYVVTAYAEAGTAATAFIPVRIDSDGCEAFNFGSDASEAILLCLDADVSGKTSFNGEMFNFALGSGTDPLPTFYPDGSMGASGSRSYVTCDLETYRAVDAVRRSIDGCVCWLRDYWGGRSRVKVDWTISYSASSYMTWSVGVDATEVIWEEPVNG